MEGEFIGSVVHLVEQAQPERRAADSSLASFGVEIGGLLGAGSGWLTAALVSGDALHEWGWRLPLLTAVAVGALGLWLLIR